MKFETGGSNDRRDKNGKGYLGREFLRRTIAAWEWLDYLASFRLARTCWLRELMDMSA